MPTAAVEVNVPVPLRAHHLLCVFGFRGAGYDRAHAEGIGAVIRQLQAPGARVTLVAGVDAICAACPTREEARCREDSARDRAVREALGLAVGHEEDAAELFTRVARQLSPEDLAALCAGCPWYAWGVCAEGLAAGRMAHGWNGGVLEREVIHG